MGHNVFRGGHAVDVVRVRPFVFLLLNSSQQQILFRELDVLDLRLRARRFVELNVGQARRSFV